MSFFSTRFYRQYGALIFALGLSSCALQGHEQAALKIEPDEEMAERAARNISVLAGYLFQTLSLADVQQIIYLNGMSPRAEEELLSLEPGFNRAQEFLKPYWSKHDACKDLPVPQTTHSMLQQEPQYDFWEVTRQGILRWACIVDSLGVPPIATASTASVPTEQQEVSVPFLDAGGGYGMVPRTTAWLLEQLPDSEKPVSRLKTTVVDPIEWLDVTTEPRDQSLREFRQVVQDPELAISVSDLEEQGHLFRFARKEIASFLEKNQDTYRLILAMQLFHYLEKKLEIFVELYNRLQPGGLFFLILEEFSLAELVRFKNPETCGEVDIIEELTTALEGHADVLSWIGVLYNKVLVIRRNDDAELQLHPQYDKSGLLYKIQPLAVPRPEGSLTRRYVLSTYKKVPEQPIFSVAATSVEEL